MDWKSVLTAIVASSAVTGGIAYILKRSFDRLIEVHAERIKESNKALIQEASRRGGVIFDGQLKVLKRVLTLVYQTRNALRDLLSHAEKEDWNSADTSFYDLVARNKELTNLLYEERLFLPPSFFGLAHELRNSVNDLYSATEYAQHRRKKGSSSENSRTHYMTDMKHISKRADEIYSWLATGIQRYIGIEDEDSEPEPGAYAGKPLRSG